jgi:NADH-quinone oxidoreductase subunit N
MPLPTEDLIAILPFIIAVTGGLTIILLDLFTRPEVTRAYLGGFALVFLGAMLLSCAVNIGAITHVAFFGSVVSDDLSRSLTIIFAVAAALAALIAMGRLPEKNTIRGEFYALLLFATGGASLLVQALDMVTLFIGLETLSIPAYILAAAVRADKRSTEAGFKYFILGAFSSGFLVYGIALIYGATGSTVFSKISEAAANGAWAENPLLVVGFLMVLTGLCFKIGAAPFHMWAPDVYQGSPTSATAFFATGIKAAAFTALIRLLYVAVPGMKTGIGELESVGWYPLVQGLAILTMTAANLTALVQTDVKRILSYSSIAHAGYLFIGLLAGADGATAMLFYLAAYTFMTAGAFALVAYFEKLGAGTSLEEYRGLGRQNAVAAVVLSIFLFSLAGIPPTAGFFGKFYLFKVAVENDLTWLVVIAVLNSAVSAYYYLRIMVSMYMQSETEKTTSGFKASLPIALAVAICLYFVIAMGIFPIPYLDVAKASIASMF